LKIGFPAGATVEAVILERQLVAGNKAGERRVCLLNEEGDGMGKQKPGKRSNTPSPSRELKNFTNRVQEQAVFQKYVDAPEGTSLPVLMFFGVGGIGKTWLVQQLRDNLGAPGGSIPHARLDFDHDAGGKRFGDDPAAALSEIRQLLGVPCPRYDLAYAMLRYKQGAGAEPTLQGSGDAKMAFDAVVAFVLAPVPAGSILAELVKRVRDLAAPKFKNTALYRWLASKNGEGDLPGLAKKTWQEIQPELIDRLCADLQENLPERKGKACRAVIFLDTYEALRIDIANEAQQRKREAWIRDLCANLDGVLVVIAGQNRLDWPEIDPAWDDRECLEQHLVGGFSETDARELLGKYGATSRRLQDAILRICAETEIKAGNAQETAYHSWSLGLCGDIVFAEGGKSDPASLSRVAIGSRWPNGS
jgi:hypothetical protein